LATSSLAAPRAVGRHEPRPGTLLRLMARLSAAKTARGVRANLGNVVITEAIETQTKQVRRDFARLVRRLERHVALGALLLASDTLPPLLVNDLATARAWGKAHLKSPRTTIPGRRGTARSRHEPGRRPWLIAACLRWGHRVHRGLALSRAARRQPL
jgi:hypothetical protein